MDQPIELTAETLWTSGGSAQGGAQRSPIDVVRRGGRLDVSDDTFVLAVPNDFTREWIEAISSS